MKTNLRTILITILILATIAACAAPHPATAPIPVATPTTEPTTPAATSTVSTPDTSPTPCVLSPVLVPTRPAQTPPSLQLDPTTGLHMTGIPQEIDLASYRLKVTGKVAQPLSLTYDDLRCMPKIRTTDAPLICPGYFEDGATWAGASLEYVLELAGLQADAGTISLIGDDRYSASVTLLQARLGNNYLAYEWHDQPLPVLHGFPVRAVFSALPGNKWVKWLVEIKVE